MGSKTLRKTEALINHAVNNTVLENGGTVHLHMSSPGVAALSNHTDTTDIAVLQLEGEKE